MAQTNIMKGSLFALMAFFFMAVFGILTKAALINAHVVWVSFLAYLTGTLILAVCILPRGIDYLKSGSYGCLVSRALFGTAASLLYTLSIQYIPIVNGTLLFNTAPIFIPILAVCFLKMSIEKYIWLAIALGFLGIIIIIKPTEQLFTQPGNLIGLVSGISLAIAYLVMKILTATDPAERIIFYYLGIGTILQAPFLFYFEPAPSMASFIWACASGVVLLLAQLSLVKAYTYAEASQVGIYQYASVVFVGIFNWVIWKEVPPLSDLAGVALVAVAGMIIIGSGSMAAKKQA